jgi:hypothetical protein
LEIFAHEGKRKACRNNITKGNRIEESIHHLGFDFFYRCGQATSTPTHYDDDFRVVEQRVQLLQGATPRVNDGEAQT